jgi:uncharacterized protein YyaL (SSP411 family)
MGWKILQKRKVLIRAQLGVNGKDAVVNGGLAGNAKFFGTATAEVVTRAAVDTYNSGGWNGDYANTVHSTLPWFTRGGHVQDHVGAGLFAFLNNFSNTPEYRFGHRTILSGY